MIDDRTEHLDLPLPNTDNLLDEDVVRLVAAINAIDAKFAALDTLLASPDVALDTIQEIVAYISANRADITAILTAKLAVSVYVDRVSPYTAAVMNYNPGTGRLTSMTETLVSGGTRVTTLTYNGDGTVNTVRTQTASYDRMETVTYSSGKVAFVTVVE